MQRFVDFGAPPETAYTSNPHLGSNKIRALITKMTDHLKEQGCSFHYNSRVEELLMEGSRCVGVKTHDGKTYKSSNIVLATGHSSKEMYKHINECSVAMKAKDFAVGVRIEHPRREIDSIQYGEFASKELGAARYKLTYQRKDLRPLLRSRHYFLIELSIAPKTCNFLHTLCGPLSSFIT